jgi:hypothetical protein
LVESVKAVESNPSQYGLDAGEVTRRKRLVQEVGGEIEDMRDELTRPPGPSGGGSGGSAAKGKSRDGTTRGAGGGGGGGVSDDLPHPNAFAIPSGEGEDYAAEFEQEQQLQMMREQDEQLDDVFQTVGNLRRQADDMGRELEEQREMLEVVDNLADRVGGRLQTGVQKLQRVIRQNEDRWSSCCIGILIVVLVILLILLLVL